MTSRMTSVPVSIITRRSIPIPMPPAGGYFSATLPEGEDAKSGLAILPNPISAVNTRKELADAVGLRERTMGKVMQIDEHAPDAVKEALDKKELSINQGYQITKQVQDLPEEERDQAALEAVEQEKAKKEIRRKDAEIDRRSKIAGVFCKAFEKAVLITPTEENVRIWAECTRMTPEELADTVQEARELSETFSTIADIMEQKILPTDWRNAASGDEPDSDDSERPKDGGDS